MRPTDLGFRNPKEKTPDAYVPLVTCHGKSLNYSKNSNRGSFSQSKRFNQYDIDAKRTGYRIGPGSYESFLLQVGKSKRGGPVYKAFHGQKDVSNNGYFYIGNQLVFDTAFVLKSRRSSLGDKNCNVEYFKTCHKYRPDSAKGKNSDYSTPRKKPRSRPTSAMPSKSLNDFMT